VASRIPTEQELATSFDVARGTVRNALRLVCDEGILEQKRGIGCFVSPHAVRLRPVNRKFAVILPFYEGRNFGPGMYLGGIEKAAAAADWEMSIFSLDRDSGKIDEIFSKLEKRAINRVLFLPACTPDSNRLNNRIIDGFEARGLRYAVLDMAVLREGIIRGDFVGADNYRAMRVVVRRLAECGFRELGFISVFPGLYSGDQRRFGVIDELQVRELPVSPDYFVFIDDVPLAEQGRNQVRQWLDSSKGLPEVILCSHDIIAFNVLDELHTRGVRVPQDVKVIGFDDLPGDESLGLSSVRQPFERVAVRAVELLLDEKRDTVVQELFPCEYIERRSSSKCPGKE